MFNINKQVKTAMGRSMESAQRFFASNAQNIWCKRYCDLTGKSVIDDQEYLYREYNRGAPFNWDEKVDQFKSLFLSLPKANSKRARSNVVIDDTNQDMEEIIASLQQQHQQQIFFNVYIIISPTKSGFFLSVCCSHCVKFIFSVDTVLAG